MIVGKIWDATRKKMVFDWIDDGGTFHDNQVIWCASGTVCFVEACQVLVRLPMPSHGGLQLVAYEGPRLPRPAREAASFSLSPWQPARQHLAHAKLAWRICSPLYQL